MRRSSPIGSLRSAGARIVRGSNGNVASVNPRLAIEVGMTRRDPSGARTTVSSGTKASTHGVLLASCAIDAAGLMHRGCEIASDEAGKRAHRVVLAHDLFAIPAADVGAVAVPSTCYAGRAVHAPNPKPAPR